MSSTKKQPAKQITSIMNLHSTTQNFDQMLASGHKIRTERHMQAANLSMSIHPKESVVSFDTNEPLIFQDEKLLPLAANNCPTLVIGLDEMLVHYEPDSRGGGRLHTRPGLRPFLYTVSQMFELVIFSASLKSHSDFIIDQIDSSGWIKHRLCKDHLTYLSDGSSKRDFERLGRHSNRLFIVLDSDQSEDQVTDPFGYTIRVPAWFGDTRDKTLPQLSEKLETLFQNYRE